MKRKYLSWLMVGVMMTQTGVGSFYTTQAKSITMSERQNDENVVQIVKGESRQLYAPEDFVGEVSWSSSNSPIAEVTKEGMVQAKEKGRSLIKARDEKGNEKEWTIDVRYTEVLPEVSQEVYAQLREKWLISQIPLTSDETSANVQRVIKRIEDFATTHWESIQTDGGVLWESANVSKYETDPAHIRTMYLNLEWMAKAYATPATKYYKNQQLLEDLKYSLEWLYTHAYHEKEQYGNWWQWEIGIPKALNNICVLLYDELGKDTLMKYTDVIYFHQPDPFHSGASGVSTNRYRLSEAANRVDVALVSLVLGMLREDAEQLLMTRDAISSLLTYQEVAEDGTYIDGFYTDGSFIQHGHVPYIGTYGNVFLSGAATIAEVLRGSELALSVDAVDVLVDFALDAFAPLMYKGAVMDMARGRAISRFNETDRRSGHGIIGSFLHLSQVVSEELGQTIKEMAKSWIEEDTMTDFIEGTNNIHYINITEAILKDESLENMSARMMHKNFSLMDRIVHKGKDYAIGLSMFSSRISNFEYMNGENKRGWHTSSGMMYLYNNDLAHYSDNYWNTINPYRLPGTTIDTVVLDKEDLKPNEINGQKLFSKEDWVGGVTLGNYGVAGMALNGDLVTDKGETSDHPLVQTLQAKKSYFMFEDEIICLGAGITSTDGRTIETIVENRKLKDDGSNQITFANGKQTKTQWLHLEGNVEGADIGYYFPTKQHINVQKVENTGAWADVRIGGPKEEVTKTYAEMWFDHGVNPKNESYAYAVLPNKSVEEMKLYSRSKAFDILKNDAEVQAVKHNKLDLIGANFWSKDGGKIAGISVNAPASMMVQNKEGILTVALSDPTMKHEGIIEVELNRGALEVIAKDEAITVTQLMPKVKLQIDTTHAQGRSIEVTLQTKK